MTVEQAIHDISSLPPLDRLRIVQAIWDGLPDDIGTELTSVQRQELGRRWAEYENDPGSALTEEEFRASVRNARQR